MAEVVVHRGPGCRIGPGGHAGGAVVTVALWRWDGYHRRVVTSGRDLPGPVPRAQRGPGGAGIGGRPLECHPVRALQALLQLELKLPLIEPLFPVHALTLSITLLITWY